MPRSLLQCYGLTGTVPKTITDNDSQGINLGTKFTSKYSGEVTGIRFYKGPQNTGIHVGSLLTSSGVKLASVTFKNETNIGWQEADLSEPVNIAANTTYIVAYYAPHGYYSGGYKNSRIKFSNFFVYKITSVS